jgi:hypothetical protein
MTQLRVLAWNCTGGIARKLRHVTDPLPDIAILSEVGAECVELLGGPDNVAWVGQEGKRGLAVVSFNGWTIAPHSMPNAAERLFLPIVARRGNRTVRILGCCVKDASGYAIPALDALERYAEFLRAGPAIVAGDFNLTVRLDAKRPAARRCRPVMNQFAELGLRSVWHAYSGEDYGEESVPTHFWRWQATPEAAFHIDYIFVSSDIAIRQVEIGTHADFAATAVSDHAPIIADLTLRISKAAVTNKRLPFTSTSQFSL